MKRILLHILFIALGITAVAHEGHHHGSHTQEAKTADAKKEQRIAFSEIAADYEKSVQPIFDSKCAACHSANSKSPWYSKIPGIHQLVEKNRSQAKEHLEISKGFPFGGHGEPLEDLKAIREVIQKDSMPTGLYSFMHPSSKLTKPEAEAITAWATAGEAKLVVLTQKEKHQ